MAGAVQTCRPVPGALSSRGTEMVFPRIWEYRLAFGVVIEWNSFAFRRRCHSGVGFPKGRGRSPAPLCRFKGVRGKQAKRRQWRIKRACFEEAARLAAPKRGRESQCRDGVENRNPPGFHLGPKERASDDRAVDAWPLWGRGGTLLFSKEKCPSSFPPFSPAQGRKFF